MSVGCGVYPADPIGDFNIQKFMSLNKDSVLIFKALRVLPNLLKLLGNAVSILKVLSVLYMYVGMIGRVMCTVTQVNLCS